MSSVTGTIAQNVRQNLRMYTLIFALIIICVIFSILDSSFMTPMNASNLFRQLANTALLSCGMVLVIVTGGIDLSVGNATGFISCVSAGLQANNLPAMFGYNPSMANANEIMLVICILGVFIALLTGVVLGLFQGYIIAYLRVPPFIATLGGMWLFKGLILRVTEGKTIGAYNRFDNAIAMYIPPIVSWIIAIGVVVILIFTMLRGRQKKRKYGITPPAFALDVFKTAIYSILILGYTAIVNNNLVLNRSTGEIITSNAGLPIPVLILAIVAVLVTYISKNTRFGRYAYAIGGNREASRLSGINIKKTLFGIYVLMGTLCGISGVIYTSYVQSGTTSAGLGWELDAIAACILGGTSTLGGEGTIFGAMIGAVILGALTTGMQILGITSEYQYIIKGLILIVAVWADMAFKKTSKD